MIASLPDPVESSTSYQFDVFFEGLTAAAEACGFVLDRYRFPWGDLESRERDRLRSVETEQRPRSHDDPGLLLFRHLEENKKTVDLLLVFVVTETTSSGIDKNGLKISLELQRDLDLLRYPTPIQGPSYSGSQESLREAILAWMIQEKNATFNIVSGDALGIDRQAIDSIFGTKEATKDAKQRATFHSAMHPIVPVVHVLLAELDPDFAEPVAILYEENSGFGQQFSTGIAPRKLSSDSKTADASAQRKSHTLRLYSFPIHVSEIRRSYERSGLLRDREGQTLHSAERLHAALDETETPRDYPARRRLGCRLCWRKPRLTEIMRDIHRREIRSAVIVATDARTSSLSARAVRFSPDIVLGTMQTDSLLHHPEFATYLRGMLVASTYPLRVLPLHHGRDVNGYAFQSEFTNGVFNATLNIFSSLHQAKLLEFVNPPTGMYVGYDSAFLRAETRRGQEQPDWPTGLPPIWVSVVGNSSTYPVRIRPPLPEDVDSVKHYMFEDSNKQSTGDYFRLRPSTFYVQVILCLIVLPSLGLSVAVGLLYLRAMKSSSKQPARPRGLVEWLCLTPIRYPAQKNVLSGESRVATQGSVNVRPMMVAALTMATISLAPVLAYFSGASGYPGLSWWNWSFLPLLGFIDLALSACVCSLLIWMSALDLRQAELRAGRLSSFYLR